MANHNLYLEKLELIRSRLYLALEMLQTMPPVGVLAILRKSARLLPYNVDIFLKNYPFEVENSENRLVNFKAAFKILVQKSISALISINKERSSRFYTDIELELSLNLEGTDPAAKEENDNLILSIPVPWLTIWPDIINNSITAGQEAVDLLYDYILRTALPSIISKDFLRADTLYADITLTEAKGYRLDHDVRKATEISREELADLLVMKVLPELAPVLGYERPLAKTCIVYIEELIALLDQLINSSPKKDGERDRLALKVETLLHDFRRIYKFSNLGDCLLSYGQRPDWKLFGTEHHVEMACLDGLMRELEDLAVERINKDYREIEKISHIDGFEIKEEDFPEGNILTFWTNRGKFPCTIPFWEVETNTGLFKDGEDWHEFHPYKPMCYLSHIAFIDGDINFEELKYIDYITWEMRFRHDITVNISRSPEN